MQLSCTLPNVSVSQTLIPSSREGYAQGLFREMRVQLGDLIKHGVDWPGHIELGHVIGGTSLIRSSSIDTKSTTSGLASSLVTVMEDSM